MALPELGCCLRAGVNQTQIADAGIAAEHDG